MKISYLFIDGYKNLNNIELTFEEKSSVNALIGNNGSGKSNILEAITTIFLGVHNGAIAEEFSFNFHIKYSIDSSYFEIINRINQKFAIMKDGEELDKKNLIKALPKTVFLYYCGETDRLREISSRYLDKSFDKALKNYDEIRLRFLSYLTVKDFGIALLSNAVYNNSTFYKICNMTNIIHFSTLVKFKFKRPYWGKSGPAENFWNARGTVAFVLKQLVESSDGNSINVLDKDNVELSIYGIENLKDNTKDAAGLFVMLKMLMQADILDDVDFDVIKQDGQRFNYHHLSEGEKQLCQLLSILEITKEYKALFLLDEFDAYLHPNWQREFVDIIGSINIRGQVLFTTHSPLTLGKIQKENIVLLNKGIAYDISADTYNRDASEIMVEVMNISKRPPEIEDMIKQFRSAVVHRNLSNANRYAENIKKELSEGDPFLITLEVSLKRLGW